MRIIESPIRAVVGNKGSCKTLFTTYNAEKAYFEDGRKIYANYHLTNIPYEYFTYDMLLDMPESMRHGVIIMDEAHMGADAYTFLSKKSKAIKKLATQLRKLDLELWITTQRFNFITYQLRQLVDYIYTMTNIFDESGHVIKGVSRVAVYDRSDPYSSDEPIEKFYFDGREFFGHYDSNEIIE